jgi:hypothetical protein
MGKRNIFEAAGAATTAGERAAARGSIAERPWHRPGRSMADELVEVCDLMQGMPGIGGMLGKNIDVKVKISPSGRGLVFEFEPAK